jgi:hypothetical protein
LAASAFLREADDGAVGAIELGEAPSVRRRRNTIAVLMMGA